MKPAPFNYVKAAALSDALRVLTDNGGNARVLAGGQSLMPMLNMRLASPDILLDINNLAELSGIERRGDVIRIGAVTRYREIETSPLVAAALPLLPFALKHVAHRAIRSRGTLGGSLALADPAAEMPACALALDATIIVQSMRGERRIAAIDFVRGIWETALADDEIIVAVEYPAPSEVGTFSFLEYARRHGDFAMAGIVIARSAAGQARTVTFGIGERAFRSDDVEAWLAGASSRAVLPPEVESKYSERVAQAAEVENDGAFRVSIATTLLKRALAVGQDTAKDRI